MSWKSISLCPKNAPKPKEKPVTQAQMLDMIGFLKVDYLTASFIRENSSMDGI